MEYNKFEERMKELFAEMQKDFEKKLPIWSRTNIDGLIDIENSEHGNALCIDILCAYLKWYGQGFIKMPDGFRAGKHDFDTIVDMIDCRCIKDPGMRIQGLNNVFEGTLSQGTFREYDLITTYLEALKGTKYYDQFKSEIPDGALEDDTHEFWRGDSCVYMLHEEITLALEGFAPDGYYFGNTEGNSSDYGFWKCEDETTTPTCEQLEAVVKEIESLEYGKKSWCMKCLSCGHVFGSKQEINSICPCPICGNDAIPNLMKKNKGE